jgi:hypothetical protein
MKPRRTPECHSNVISSHAAVLKLRPIKHVQSAICESRQVHHSDVGIKYIIVPNAVNPTPAHHHRSASHTSPRNLSSNPLPTPTLPSSPITTFCSSSPNPRFAFPVGLAVVLVGFSVCVGNIIGGVYTRYNGCMGLPSNLYKFNRGTL